MQICPHAIGSRANHDLLNAFEAALKKYPTDDHRFRSEHAELVLPDDIRRFVELGVIPSIQPIHCTSDMVFLESRIGAKRCELMASPWRSMIDAGCQPACGSDFMVESHRPLWGIYAAVTRQSHEGEPPGGWHTSQRMTRGGNPRLHHLASQGCFSRRFAGVSRTRKAGRPDCAGYQPTGLPRQEHSVRQSSLDGCRW